MDYSFFDGLIDSVFVINDSKGVVYCNQSAATLCDSSVRRLTKGKPIYEIIEFSDSNLFVMPTGCFGKDEPAPYTELKFKLSAGKEGKVQIAIQPFAEPSGAKRWVVMLRDVTIEEVLHAKYHKQLEEKEVYILQLQEAQKKLEDYSKNLEKMVEDRTQEVKRANLMLSAIMNSLGQGFFVFDREGKCLNFYTKACESILEGTPSQKLVWDVLKVAAKDLETFQMWVQAIYGEQLPFDTLKELGPLYFSHSQNRHIVLDYFPLRDEHEKISNVVVVATDQTSEHLANQALEKEKKYVQMVTKLVTSKKQFSQFLTGVQATVSELKKEVLSKTNSIDHETVFRALHTLEGEAGSCSAVEIWESSRAAQELIEPLKRGQAVDLSELRKQLISAIDNIDSSYVKFCQNNQELFLAIGMGSENKIEISYDEVSNMLRRFEVENVAQKIRDEIESLLLREPIEIAFRHFKDVVRQVASKLSKKIAPLEFFGMNTKIFLSNYNDLFATLIHVYRNAVDHGIEPSEERQMRGKPAEGWISTSVQTFEDNGVWLRIKISDDGGGISVDNLRKILMDLSLPKSSSVNLNPEGMSDYEILQTVFSSGLSTKSALGEFSGRGIGLNAVKVEVEKLGGRVWVESEMGKGTDLIIEVPDLPRVVTHRAAA